MDHLTQLIQDHSRQIEHDINLSSTREQHIRMVTRYNEVQAILVELGRLNESASKIL